MIRKHGILFIGYKYLTLLQYFCYESLHERDRKEEDTQ